MLRNLRKVQIAIFPTTSQVHSARGRAKSPTVVIRTSIFRIFISQRSLPQPRTPLGDNLMPFSFAEVPRAGQPCFQRREIWRVETGSVTRDITTHTSLPYLVLCVAFLRCCFTLASLKIRSFFQNITLTFRYYSWHFAEP